MRVDQIQKAAETSTYRIITNLRGRSGLGNAFDECDEEVQKEIVASWSTIIIRAILEQQEG